MPPSKDIGGYLSEYVHNVAHGLETDPEVQVLAMNTLNALKRSVKAGPRQTIPPREEIEALLSGRKLTTIVFFLDETFEEITYDMTTTVSDAVEVLLNLLSFYIFLINVFFYQHFPLNFSLFRSIKGNNYRKAIFLWKEDRVNVDQNGNSVILIMFRLHNPTN